MAYDFYLRHLDRDATIKNAAITDFLSLSYRKVVSEPGRLVFKLNASHPAIATIEDFDMFEVYWKNPTFGIDWHKDFEAIFRSFTYTTNDDGVSFYEASCPGQMAILGYRHNLFPAGTSNRSSFQAVSVETVAKTLVDYNLTSLATVGNNRLRNGDLTPGMGFTIVTAADLGTGPVISKTYPGVNILDAIVKKTQPIAAGDFSLVRTPSGGIDARWVFDYHLGQLGDDKTTGSEKVEFSLERGNMRTPKLTIRQLDEATVALAAGRGQGDDRLFSEVQGDDYLASNDIEVFLDSRNEATLAQVDEDAAQTLKDLRSQVELDFKVIQIPSVFYSENPIAGRKTYKVGDLVSAFYAGFEMSRKIKAVTVRVNPPSNQDAVQIDVQTERLD
jgi:hypothetical protein